MRESLRVRLVLWYSLVLALVVVLYGGAVVYQSWRSMIDGVDAELETYAREVADALEPVDGGRFDLELLPTPPATSSRAKADVRTTSSGTPKESSSISPTPRSGWNVLDIRRPGAGRHRCRAARVRRCSWAAKSATCAVNSGR